MVFHCLIGHHKTALLQGTSFTAVKQYFSVQIQKLIDELISNETFAY